MTSPIYHPASNGQAENAVRICKRMIKCAISDNLPQTIICERLLEYLFVYRNTEHCVTGESPAKLMFGRNLRSRLDLILPKEDKITCVNKQPLSKRKFTEGDTVWVRWYSSRKGFWKKGIVKEILGNRMYSVYILDINEVCVRHIDQLFKSVDASRDLDVSQPSSSPQSSVTANSSAQYQSVSMPLALPSPTVHTEAPVPSAVVADTPVEQIVEEEGHVECERGISVPNTSGQLDPPLTPPRQADRPLTPTSPPRFKISVEE
ncbi:hypothetical protein JYU34_011642 [Plutella xylostella]|uniref:Integrase catalytic domain-containing protein n=1 Tax=Plutella xylostella TaxID=51655 RepID=A0ABQ7QD97_PLUXY|nr:hypothetical protein JYU34_011642 [Plutella xylostella]